MLTPIPPPPHTARPAIEDALAEGAGWRQVRDYSLREPHYQVDVYRHDPSPGAREPLYSAWTYSASELAAYDACLAQLFAQLFMDIEIIDHRLIAVTLQYWNDRPLLLPTNVAANPELTRYGARLAVARMRSLKVNHDMFDDNWIDVLVSCDHYVLAKTSLGMEYAKETTFASWEIKPSQLDPYCAGWRERLAHATLLDIDDATLVDYVLKSPRPTPCLDGQSAAMDLPDMAEDSVTPVAALTS